MPPRDPHEDIASRTASHHLTLATLSDFRWIIVLSLNIVTAVIQRRSGPRLSPIEAVFVGRVFRQNDRIFAGTLRLFTKGHASAPSSLLLLQLVSCESINAGAVVATFLLRFTHEHPLERRAFSGAWGNAFPCRLDLINDALTKKLSKTSALLQSANVIRDHYKKEDTSREPRARTLPSKRQFIILLPSLRQV